MPWFYVFHRADLVECDKRVKCTKQMVYGNETVECTQCFFQSSWQKSRAVKSFEEKGGNVSWLAEASYEFNAVLQMMTASSYPVAGWVEVPSHGKIHTLHWRGNGFIDVACQQPMLSRPLILKNPDPKALTFDIETFFFDYTIPTDEKGNLQERTGDLITCIALEITELKEGGAMKSKKLVLVLKGNESPTAEFCKAKTVIEFANELAMLKVFLQVLREEKCVLMIGYNSLRFDMPYLTLKMRRHGLEAEWLTCMSVDNSPGRIKEPKTFDGKQSGHRMSNAHAVAWHGVVHIDLFAIVVREYNLKDNKLGSVAAKFLDGDTKDPMTPTEMFRSHEQKDYRLLAKYCMQDVAVTTRLSREGLKAWPTMIALSSLFRISFFELLTGGEQKRTFHLFYHEAHHKNFVINTPPATVVKNGRYKGAHVLEPLRGCYKRDCVSFDFNSLYPNIIISSNMCHTTYVAEQDVGIVAPKEHLTEFKLEYHDGCVHDPKHQEMMVLEASIKSLTNEKNALALEHANNLKGLSREMKSATKKRQDEEMKRAKATFTRDMAILRKERLALKDRMTKRGEGSEYCTQRGLRSYTLHYFYKPEILKGLLPIILETLIKSRKTVKQMMALKKEEHETLDSTSEMILLDKRQLALKVAANSMYGTCGATFGHLQHAPISSCVTSEGRAALAKMKDIIENEMGGIVVYGDTDSNYVRFPRYATMDNEDVWRHATSVAETITSRFKAPMKLEMENYYAVLLLLNKKTYVNTHVRRDGSRDPKLYSKGTKLDRCEWPSAFQKLYEHCIMQMIDENGTWQEVDFKRYLRHFILDLCKHHKDLIPSWIKHCTDLFDCSSIDLTDLVQAKKMKGDYSNHINVPAHAYAAERAKVFGFDVSSTTMIHCIICVQDVVGLDGLLKHRTEEGLKDRTHHLEVVKLARELRRIDTKHYIENLLKKTVENVLSVKFPNFTLPETPKRPFAMERFIHLCLPFQSDANSVRAFCESVVAIRLDNPFLVQKWGRLYPVIQEPINKVARIKWSKPLTFEWRECLRYSALVDAMNKGDWEPVANAYRRCALDMRGLDPLRLEHDFQLLAGVACAVPPTTTRLNWDFARARARALLLREERRSLQLDVAMLDLSSSLPLVMAVESDVILD